MTGPARARRFALAGNPNCGKTTLFNALTGLRQRVGNYPGVTVERKEGRFHGPHGEPWELVDLPGSYSLQPRSPDEAVTRDVLLGRLAGEPQPDAIVCVLDASNLERNLYLLCQVLETGLPVVVALNMVDLAEARGLRIDVAALAAAVGAEVVPLVASRQRGLVELRQALGRARPAPTPRLDLGAVGSELDALAAASGGGRGARLAASLAWTSADADEAGLDAAAWQRVVDARARAARTEIDPVARVVEARYAWCQGVVAASVTAPDAQTVSWSDRLDQTLTHGLWGWVFFIGVMAALFFAVFSLAAYPMELIDGFFGWLGGVARGALPAGDFASLVVDGVIAGVGGVVIFLPQILLLFLFLGLLEDTGYMARAAFIIDRVMRRVGLHGKSFIPLLSSFACAIPGILAARTIDTPRDRLATILVAPFMSCSARLPVYILLISLLVPGPGGAWTRAGLMLGLYLLGMAAAFGMAWFWRRTVLRGDGGMLMLEMPPYRVPAVFSLLVRVVERAFLFVRRAGTVILSVSVLLWAAATYPKHPDPDAPSGERMAHSVAGRLGQALEPVVAPLGYDWKIAIGILGSFAAREVFVSTMAVVYSIEDEGDAGVQAAMAAERRPDGGAVYTPLVCLSLLVFYVLALQCVSTLVVAWRETGSWRWAALMLVSATGLAYVAALAVYQGGRLLGFS